MARIAMTTNRTFAYGASRMTLHYARALREAGHEVEVLYAVASDAASANGSVLPELAESGVPARHVPSLRRAAVPGFGGPLSEALRRFGPDLVVTTQVGDAAAGTRAAAKLGTPSLLFAQNMMRIGGQGPARWLKKAIYRRALQRAASIVCVAPAVRSVLIEEFGADPAKSHVVLNGLDLDAFPAADGTERAAVRAEFNVPEGVPLLVTLARMHRQKALPDLVEAARLLKAGGQDFRLVVAGNASSDEERAVEADVRQRVREGGLEDHVILAGFRSDGPRLLHGADLFVLSSAWEGLPLVVLEAMAASLPVVMTQYGERFEGFRDGEDGWYVPVHDPPALAAAIRGAVELPAERLRAVGGAGRDYMRRNLTLDEGKRQFVEAAGRAAGAGAL